MHVLRRLFVGQEVYRLSSYSKTKFEIPHTRFGQSETQLGGAQARKCRHDFSRFLATLRHLDPWNQPPAPGLNQTIA